MWSAYQVVASILLRQFGIDMTLLVIHHRYSGRADCLMNCAMTRGGVELYATDTELYLATGTEALHTRGPSGKLGVTPASRRESDFPLDVTDQRFQAPARIT